MPNPSLLIFIEHYLPGYKFGGPTQSVANLVALLKNHYTISIITRDRDFGEQTPYANLPADEWLPGEGYRIRYVSYARSGFGQVWALLREQPYDFVYTNSLFADFTRQLLGISLLTNRRLVIAPRGELHPGALRLKAYKKRPYVWLTQLLFKNQLIWHATDEEELRAIGHHFTRYRVQFAPVRFAPDTPRQLVQRSTHQKEAGSVRLVFISRLTQKKGLRFLLSLLTHYTINKVVLDVYGPIVDQAEWLRCEALIAQMPPNCRVTYRGAISHDQVNNTLVRYDFFVLPTLGENFGHAIFESLSAGVPVLVSDQTPWRNLTQRRAGWDLPLLEADWLAALNASIGMTNETYGEWSAQATAMTMAYVADNQFEQSYLSLFS